MTDKLIALLRRFQLRARVFHSGPACGAATYDAGDGLAYIHVLQHGRLQVEAPAHPTLVIDEPSLFVYMNPTYHRMLPLDPATSLVCASFDFGAGLRNPIARALPEVVVMRLADAASLSAALALLFDEATRHDSGRQAVLDRLIEVVIVQVLRDLTDSQRIKAGLLAGLADPRLGKAINAMHEDPGRRWSLASLADTAGMSRARFAARFHDVVGITPAAYLGEWRVAVAQTLLRQGKSVQLVADAVGYNGASALSRAFRALTGQSPSQWLRSQADRP